MMGFLSKLTTIKKKQRSAPLCLKCQKYRKCKNTNIPPVGLGKKEILIINNWATKNDDLFVTHMSGDVFKYLSIIFENSGISIHNDCWRTSLVSCGGSKVPTKKEMDYCFPNIIGTISKLSPKKIVLVGDIVCEKFFKKRCSKNVSVNKARGTRVWDADYNTWVYPIWHPETVLYDTNSSSKKIIEAVYKRDIQFIANSSPEKSDTPSLSEIKKMVTCTTDFSEIRTFLKRVLKTKPYFAFDYETTGIKPYLVDHKIVSVAVATSAGEYYSFPLQHDKVFTKKQQDSLVKLWGSVLQCGGIRKIVHNLNFEYIWSAVKCHGEPEGMFWDTQLMSHVLDNRRGITNLKYQLFTRFGIGEYDKGSKKYISSGDGEFNRMMEMPIPELLLYNAIDALGTLWLYKAQRDELKERSAKQKNLKRAANFFHQGQLSLAQVSLNGIPINEKYYKEQIEINNHKCQSLLDDIMFSEEALLFKKKMGRDILITSLDDLKLLFYDDDFLGLTPTKTTEKGSASLDAEAMGKIGTPFAAKILELRKFEKMGSTYLKNMLKETQYGLMHPFFNLHIPVSFRSSSSGPNFQNLPKRDARMMSIIRKGIVPGDDYLLGEGDFSGAEVTTSGCTHLDENFLNYLRDPSTDMHRDNACDLFCFTSEELNGSDLTHEQLKLAKKIRFFSKNMWTFAQFYGDWYGSCAPNLWENVVEAGLMTPQGITVKEHLSNHGIFTYDEFERHCSKIEDKMWYERFPQYTQWKKDIVGKFIKTGYIETYIGFILSMVMDTKQCANLIIQGTSFHLLLYTLIIVNREVRKRKMKTKVCGQIHDSLIARIHGTEFKEYRKILRTVIKSLPNKFKWLIIPMGIELEISKLGKCGGNFSDMREVPI